MKDDVIVPSTDPHLWRTAFEVDLASGAAPLGVPVMRAGAYGLARLLVDIVRGEGGERFAVLLCQPEDGAAPAGTGNPRLAVDSATCLLAFTNDQAWGDTLRARGFECVDAEIELAAARPEVPSQIVVRVPFYPPLGGGRTDAAAGILGDPPVSAATEFVPFLAISNLDLDPPGTLGDDGIPEPVESRQLEYRQLQRSPEPGRPLATAIARADLVRYDQAVAGRRAALEASLTAKAVLPSTPLALQIEPARYPDLSPFTGGRLAGTLAARGALSGWPASAPLARALQPGLIPRDHLFGRPSFIFTDVETIGFRIDLGQIDEHADDFLEELVAPLNFHLRDRTGTALSLAPFRFRAASATLVVELLRYGRMLQKGSPDLRDDDFTAQHELAVRLLVGRVDDDTRQARSPAVFVPAIFVDNPWSKVVGRELLGYDKQLAHFCEDPHGEQPLAMSGRRRGESRGLSSLADVRGLRLMAPVGRQPRQGTLLLRIACPDEGRAPSGFGTVDTLRARGFATETARWRQRDFVQPEFRRSFAATVVADGLLSFDSIQPMPVDARGLPPAWIHARYRLSNAIAAFPSGIATITFPDPASLGADTPAVWRRLCARMPRAPLAFPTGEWYRLRCAMDLEVRNLLAE